MSKISLEPNASGAGTFTLSAPNSNTNRTLNLPDEAGKLLSTGNDDPAEVFKQSNILGTVSESGGVPTGAIIERGSNSNGEYVKYADGTLIAHATNTVDFNGDVDLSSRREFTTPIQFSANTSSDAGAFGSVHAANFDASGRRFQNGLLSHLQFSGSGASSGRNRWVCATLDSATADISELCRFFAIGRWY